MIFSQIPYFSRLYSVLPSIPASFSCCRPVDLWVQVVVPLVMSCYVKIGRFFFKSNIRSAIISPTLWHTVQAVSLLPILISAIVALQRRDYSDSRTELRALDPRGILASVLTPRNFSSFGLCRKQTPSTTTVAVLTANRLMCGILLLVILQGQACVVEMQRGQEYFCECITISSQGARGEWQSLGLDEWSCPTEVKLGVNQLRDGLWRWNRTVLRGNAIGTLCRFGTPNSRSYFGRDIGLFWMVPEFDCSLGGMTAPMLKESCEAEDLDIVKFQICRNSVPQFFLGVCDGAYTVCALLSGDMRLRKVALLIYIFLPLCCLLGLILVHLVAFLAGSSLTRIQENTTLRKQVKKTSQIYQEQLQNGNLEHSVWCLGMVHSETGFLET